MIQIQVYIWRNLNNRKYITFIEYVGDEKDIIPNLLILSGKQYLKKYFEQNNWDKNSIYLTISDFDYFNNEIGIQ